ncbi:unnamed protein product [Blepharisma stoltei]|uniref:Uncharacterized protein n=1 Tax=Blepharisma stoltei TaxID=1481888 RepID=A0AAU9IJ13_9CILI|nr:unnamed protein product [Blepharisma stoltei]
MNLLCDCCSRPHKTPRNEEFSINSLPVNYRGWLNSKYESPQVEKMKQSIMRNRDSNRSLNLPKIHGFGLDEFESVDV